MDVLPSNIVSNIFSRVPVKCLARSRCVSKVWRNCIDDRYIVSIHDKRVVEEPTPIFYHKHLYRGSLCFHTTESKYESTYPGTTDHVLEVKERPLLEYLHKKPLSESFKVGIDVRGSCNGLICLSQDDSHVITSLAVVHPHRKECYELPPFPLRFDKEMLRESCGLGFDASTNTFKMVCVLLKEYTPPDKHDMVKKNLCTMVHVLGTNSWREVPQVPCYPITGEAIFVNGCLHWLVSHLDVPTQDGGRPVIWFDVNKEEFGLINRPRRMCDFWRKYSSFKDQLVDLNGEVGYVCTKTMEVWVLKHKEWVPHCLFTREIPPEAHIYVMGCWNKDGDILIKYRYSGDMFFVYNLKSGVLHKLHIAGGRYLDSKFIMYYNTLSSIHGINTISMFPMKKPILKESCQLHDYC